MADALLEAHVRHVVERLSEPALRTWLEGEVDAVLADARQLKLKDAVTPTQIKRTARAFAVEMEPAGGLPELIALTARRIHAHPVFERTTPNDLVTHQRYEDSVDKFVELRTLREKIVREAVASPVYIAFATDLLFHGIKDYLARSSELTRGIPGANSVMKFGKSMVSRASPGLEASIDENLRRYVERSVRSTARSSAEFVLRHLNDDALRDMAREIWDRSKFTPLSSLREDISADDVEDLFVTGYEFWRELRTTPFYQELIDCGIDTLFERYGSTSLTELLEEIGVTRDMIIGEGMRYLPRVIKLLQRKKLLEPAIRRQLEPFYRSEAVAGILRDGG
ncbi:MAG: hypothetical protein PHP86_08725 [Nevskiales bacterium]|nr:hypothetical protein [Nevskiales bacterium]